MKRRTYRRALVALASTTALGLVVVSSAAAAGAPLVKLGGVKAAATLNELTFGGQVNPNGAATTYVVEYGTTASYGSTTTATPVGEGSSYVIVSTPVRGLNPNTIYHFRLKATNKYGSNMTSDSSPNTGMWGRTSGSLPASYVSSGTFTIQVPSFSETVTCTESGSGTIGNVQGSKDEYNLTLSKCALAGWPSCKVTVPNPIHLDANFFTTKEVLMMVEMGETNCGGAFSMSLAAQEAFKLTMPSEHTPLSSQPMSYTANTKWGGHSVTLTDSSNWSLVGGGTFWWESL